eukprot:7328705-Pyramimonas_sp.AAC.1
MHFIRAPPLGPPDHLKVLRHDLLEETQIKCLAAVEAFRHVPHQAVFRFIRVCPIPPRIAFCPGLFNNVKGHVKLEDPVASVLVPRMKKV